MLEKHTTKDGDVLMIAEMSDSHLINTVKLFLRRIKIIKEHSKARKFINEFDAALYNISEIDPKAAAENVRIIMRALYPYLAELYLRGIEDCRDLLCEVMERKVQLPVVFTPNNVLELNEVSKLSTNTESNDSIEN